jgi:hypothetical protein
LEPVLERDTTDELTGRDGEAALVEGHERHHKSLRGARHGLIAGNLPLYGGGEQRKLARLDETEEMLARYIEASPVRHRGGGVSGWLETQKAAALRKQEGTESGM